MIALAPGSWRPDVHAGLVHLLDGTPVAEASPPLAALDFDDTCIDGDISLALLDELARELGQPLVETYEAHCAVDLPGAHAQLTATLVAGRTAAEVGDRTKQVLDRRIRDGRIGVVSDMRDLIAAFRSRGWTLWIVTGSPEPVVRAVVEHLDLPVDAVLGMRSEVDGAGRFTGVIVEPVLQGAGKAEALWRATGRRPTFAAGDSASDRQLLESAQHALLIDRGDASLAAVARRAGWLVQARA